MSEYSREKLHELCDEAEAMIDKYQRARRHAWYTAFAITLFLSVVTGIAYLATDSVFLKAVVCLVAGCG